MHYLTFYNLRIKEIATNQFLKVDGFAIGKDIIVEFDNYAKANIGKPVNHMKSLPGGQFSNSTTEYKNSNLVISDRYVAGLLETGESGKASRVLDTTLVGKSKNPVAYNKKKSDALMQPFTYLLLAPAGSDRALLALQKNGVAGIKGYFNQTFVLHFESAHPGLKIELSRVTPAQAMTKVLSDGIVKNFRFIKKDVPTDIADRLKNYDKDAAPEEMELVIKAKRSGAIWKGGVLGKFMNAQHPDFKSIVEFPDFDYDTVKVDIQIGGKNRVIDLGKLGSIVSNIDISDNITYDFVSGYPHHDSVVKEAFDIASAMV